MGSCASHFKAAATNSQTPTHARQRFAKPEFNERQTTRVFGFTVSRQRFAKPEFNERGALFMERQILLLGNPQLYEASEKVTREELEELRPIFADMFDCIKGIRRDYGFGRAIAAPQIGVMKRIICILTDKPYVIINPELEFVGDEMMELMDDCMSFPKLLVRVRRYRHCILRYLNENWEPQEMRMDDDMSELIQHEYDHLDGILATMRAIDNKSFVMKE